MTFDGPIDEYLHEVAMRGHNRPPKDALTAEERLAKVFQIAMSGKGSAVEALVEITAIAGMSAQNLFSATIEEWCRITRTKNKKNARTYRDSLFRKGWSEVEGEGRRKTFKAGYTEDQITTAIEAMRGEVLASTGGEVLQSTPQEVLDSTPTGTGEYPLEVRTSTPQQVRTSTPVSRTRVSYTGEDNNNNNNNTTEVDSQGAAAVAVVVDFEALADRLHEAGGRALNRSLGALEAVTEPLAWIEAGADLERDIIPTVRRLSKGRPANSINSWSYFTKAVAERREKRLGIAGEFKPEPVEQEVKTMTREEFANAEYL